MAASILVAYYSMTGRTRAIANEISRATGADIEEIREPRRREGLPGLWTALLDSLARRRTPILPPNRNPAHYDIVIIGGPIWAGRMAPPLRTFAKRHAARAPQVAFFCTAGGRKGDAAFADLQRLCRKAPRATWLVDARHLEPCAHRAEMGHFVSNAARSALAKTPKHQRRDQQEEPDRKFVEPQECIQEAVDLRVGEREPTLVQTMHRTSQSDRGDECQQQ